MIFTPRKGEKFWPSLYWVRDKATEEVVEVIRGCILALIASGKFKEYPHELQVSKVSSYLHDLYYRGHKWRYNFDTKIRIAPGLPYHIKLETARLTKYVFSSALIGEGSPFRKAKALEVDWDKMVQCVICNQDMAGSLFGRAEERITEFGPVVYPANYRVINSIVLQKEGLLV